MTKELETFFNLMNKQSELTPAEVEVREKYFRSQIYGTENSGETRAKLKDFFFTQPKDTIEKSKRFWYSYWRWYSMLNWTGFMGLTEADMLFSFAYQVPMAVAFDYNPADELRRWLALNCPYEEDMVDLYIKVQATFLASEAYVGMWQGREIYFPEVIKEVTDIGFEEDSLRQAEFQNKLSQILFPNNEFVEKYFFATSDVAVKRFISLAIFLQSVDEKEIWLAVDSFMYPEKYTNKILVEISPKNTPTVPATPVATTPKPAPVVRPPVPTTYTPKPVVPPQPVVKPIQSPATPPASPLGKRGIERPASLKPTPQQVKSQIESQFKKDANGNFIDIEGVMAKLNELAEKNNDPKIAEMIYFDESSGKFLWKLS